MIKYLLGNPEQSGLVILKIMKLSFAQEGGGGRALYKNPDPGMDF
jgi:hypothetical protein